MALVELSDRAGVSTRVLAIDAQPLILHGLRAVLAGRDDVEFVERASSATEARSLLAERRFDVAIIGLDLPGGIGLGLVEAVRRRHPHVTIVVLCSSPTDPSRARALAIGATCAIERSVSGQALIAAVIEPVRGRVAAVRTVSRIGVAPRQAQIIELLARGLSNDEIAGALGITAKTVESQLSRLYRRFDVQGRMELAMLAVFSGWLIPGEPEREDSV